MVSNQEDKFQYTIEDENQTGGKSELLLHTQSDKHDKEAQEKPIPLREANGVEIAPYSGRAQVGKVSDSRERRQFNFVQQDERPDLKVSGYLEENRSVANSCFVGLQSTMSFAAYSQKEGVAVFSRGMCSQLRVKLISEGGVAVYETAPQENSVLKPVVRCFNKNMEDDVPEELVKFE